MFCRQTFKLLIKNEAGFHHRNASNIAFIGLGNMGSKMVANLLKNGQNLFVYDVVPSAAKGLKGVEICSSPEEAAQKASIVITMLPNGKTVKETVLGEKGILKGLKKGSMLVDSSTIEPRVAQEIFKLSKDNQFKFVDAPVSGGVPGAAAGTLTFMVGGEKEDFNFIEPTLLHMGAKAYHCGNSGAGQIAKLCNNLILGVTMIGTSEAMNLGIKLGLDPKLLTSIVNISTGRSWSSDTYNPVPGVMENVPSSNDYRDGFAVQLIAKDLGLAEDVAISCNAPVPMAAVAHQLFRTMISNGYGHKDFSSIYEFLKGTK